MKGISKSVEELKQWSDLIASLHMLGHSITVATTSKQLIKATKSDSYHLIFTDYLGMNGLHEARLVGIYNCRIRVLNTLGTDAKYNFHSTNYSVGYTSSEYSKWTIPDLRQVWTLYPDNPDNSFLGFTIEKSHHSHPHSQKKNQVVLYDAEGWNTNGYKNFFDLIGSKVEIHSVVKNPIKPMQKHIINHGMLSYTEYRKLLQESKALIGLGNRYDGPDPLEALANGCVYIQPKLFPVRNKKNTKFFDGKPTDRVYTSQNPYLENHIGKPYVYTIDFHNDSAVMETIDRLLTNVNFSSYVPYEFTQEGMMKRIALYIKHQNFCPERNLCVDKPALASSSNTSPQSAVDGIETSVTCYRSKVTNSPQWWSVDLRSDVFIDSIKIDTAYDWIDARKGGFTSTPFNLTLISSHNQTISRTFYDHRLFYTWERVKYWGRYIRIDTLNKKDSKTRIIICSVNVYQIRVPPTPWTDPSSIEIITSSTGQTCSNACLYHKMICEPEYLSALNQKETLREYFSCFSVYTMEKSFMPFAPAFAAIADEQNKVKKGDCVINGNIMLLGCEGQNEKYQRLCSCRKYSRGQIAIPLNKL